MGPALLPARESLGRGCLKGKADMGRSHSCCKCERKPGLLNFSHRAVSREARREAALPPPRLGSEEEDFLGDDLDRVALDAFPVGPLRDRPPWPGGNVRTRRSELYPIHQRRLGPWHRKSAQARRFEVRAAAHRSGPSTPGPRETLRDEVGTGVHTIRPTRWPASGPAGDRSRAVRS